MGYYSDVAIQCGEKVYEMLIKVATENKFKPDKILVSDCDDIKLYVLHWDWVKWYDWFDEIIAIMDTLKKFDCLYEEEDYDLRYGYAFTRIGEEDGDTKYIFNESDLVIYERRELDLPKEGEMWECITAAIQ